MSEVPFRNDAIEKKLRPIKKGRDESSQKMFKSRANRVIDCRVGLSWVILKFEFWVNFLTMLMLTKNHLLWRFSQLTQKFSQFWVQIVMCWANRAMAF